MITSILTHIVAFLVGALVSYLALRNNPRYKTTVDKVTQRIDDKIDERKKPTP